MARKGPNYIGLYDPGSCTQRWGERYAGLGNFWNIFAHAPFPILEMHSIRALIPKTPSSFTYSLGGWWYPIKSWACPGKVSSRKFAGEKAKRKIAYKPLNFAMLALRPIYLFFRAHKPCFMGPYTNFGRISCTWKWRSTHFPNFKGCETTKRRKKPIF